MECTIWNASWLTAASLAGVALGAGAVLFYLDERSETRIGLGPGGLNVEVEW